MRESKEELWVSSQLASNAAVIQCALKLLAFTSFLIGMRKAILFLLAIALLDLPSNLIHGNPFTTAICQFAVNYSDMLSLCGCPRMLI